MYMKNAALKVLTTAIVCLCCISCATTGTHQKTYPGITGTVTKIGRHDRAMTDISFAKMEEAGYAQGDMVYVAFKNGYTFTAPIVKNYEVPAGSFCVKKESSSGLMSFAVNYANISRITGITAGEPFTLTMVKKAGYLEELTSRYITYTHKREDFASDAVFANYREVTLNGVIAPKTLYRGSHPTKTKWARAPYVSRLLEEAGIQTIINIGDTPEALTKEYLASSNEFASAYYKKLVDNQHVLSLGINRNYTEDAFMTGIVQGLTFMAHNPAPYYFHCTEGKDRTGFMGILLGMLMGADMQVVYDDYMESFINYYGLKRDSKNYRIVLTETAMPIVTWIAGSNSDTAQAAEDFLLKHGMKKEDIVMLKNRLKNQ
ncbi:MAG: tyrosine-protein phosphatase [Treponema sp.]